MFIQMPVKKNINFEGYEVIDRVVKPLGNSAYAQAPKSWAGKKVSVVLLEPVDESDSSNEK
jgi:putative transposon-encoded protein